MAASTPSAAAEAHRLMQAGRLQEALVFAERAVEGARTCLPEHGQLAALLLKLGRAADAQRVVAAAAKLDGGIADAYDCLAFLCMGFGHHDRANELYRRATQISPRVARFWYNLACSERSLGRLLEAEAACERGIALDATAYPSYQLRSELRVQAPDANHIAELQALLAHPQIGYRGLVFLGYALAKELDDVGRFDEAFRWFAAAAKARRAHLAYEVATDERKMRRIEETFSRERCLEAAPAALPPQPAVDSSRYVFILGLPRSGTTLVERILTGLPGTRSNGETENFSRALLACARGEGDVFARAAAADPRAVAADYARFASSHDPAEIIIEKLPMNYLYLGAIHRSLPEAKILVLKRSALDSCFAMYRTLFGEAYPFSYDLRDLGRYFAAYERLMNHWRRILGDRLHEIVYEDLVRDPRRIGASIAQFCGIAWSDAAVEIQNNKSVSLSASSAQVRRPIYGSSSGRWRHYERHLGPLIDTLRDRGVSLPV